MAVVVVMLTRVVHELDAETKRKIFFAALIIFVFRATPGVGEGYRWFTIDALASTRPSTARWRRSGRASACSASALVRHDHAPSGGACAALADRDHDGAVAAEYRARHWPARVDRAVFGFGARTFALIDTAAESPFAQLSMIPMLTLIAIHAPAGRRATWFALMASLMNLALVAGQLQTKYLKPGLRHRSRAIRRAGRLVVTVVAIGFAVPVAVILAFGKRAT